MMIIMVVTEGAKYAITVYGGYSFISSGYVDYNWRLVCGYLLLYSRIYSFRNTIYIGIFLMIRINYFIGGGLLQRFFCF